MRGECIRCGEVCEFRLKKVTVRAGDNGYCINSAWECSNCGYIPLLKPKEV